MKKSNILDFFKLKSQIADVPCPACGVSVLKSKLNEHLDNSCVSSLPVGQVFSQETLLKPCSSRGKQSSSPKRKPTRPSSTSNRLSRKNQQRDKKNSRDFFKNKTLKEVSENDNDDVIILEEIIPSLKKITDTDPPISTERQDPESSNCSSQAPAKECIKIVESVTANVATSKLSRTKNTKRPILSSKIMPDDYSTPKKVLVDETDVHTKKGSRIPKKRKTCNGKPVSGAEYNRITNIHCNGTDLTKTDISTITDPIPCIKPMINKKEETFICHDAKIESFNSVNPKAQEENVVNISNDQNKSPGSPSKNCSKDKEKNIILSPTSDIADILNVAKEAIENDNVFSELSDSNEKEEKKDSSKSYTPYYIANFKHILETVLNEEDNQILFNEEDRNSIAAFKALKDAAQKLYVRLFQRKYKWLRVNKINYPEITNDPLQVLEDLVRAGLVDSGSSSEINLETALDLLSLPEAKSLAKHFNFNSGKNKSEIKEMLLKHCKEHKSVFFMNGNNSIANKMLKKVKQTMGHCFRISLIPKRVFTRILMLFSLPTMSEDDDEAAGGQQQQLLTLLQVNKGELIFPDYKRTKKTIIFCDRDELIRYEEARQLETDIFIAVENKNFELAKDLYINAKEEFEDQCTSSFASRAASLPDFLKRYTSFHVYIRCMTQGVEVLQKLRQYKEAVSLLKKLLNQKVFCRDYHGRWYDRLTLNLEQHLKQPEKALKAIEEGLKDQNIRVGYRHSLLIRALRITKSYPEDDELRKQILRDASVIDAPKVIIKGRLCPRPILGRRNVFISSSSVATDEDDVTVLGVEQLAIEHYKEEGFSEGIHGEGSTFISLYSLLFWDIIYDGSIPDVFISPYQTHPLDLNSEAFFLNRENLILNHLETIRQSSIEELKAIVKSTWDNHHGQASLVSWDRFTDVEHVQGLISCLGNHILCGICARLAKDFRFTRSGVPDLVVWNPETLCVKIVEVKGPGDKLSSKQILWLDYLLKLGADAEVCLIEAVASKQLRK